MVLENIGNITLNRIGFCTKRLILLRISWVCHVFLSKEESDNLRVMQKQDRNLSSIVLKHINFLL